MKSFLSTLLLFAAFVAGAQHTDYFTIGLPEKVQPVSGARYGRVRLLDARYDSSSLGVVQTGAFNRLASVVPKPALEVQLQGLVEAQGGRNAPGTLLFQLRDFRFAELTTSFREQGWCYLRANLYAEAGAGRYALLGTLDSMIHISALDVTRGLYRRASDLLADFLQAHLVQAAADTALLTYDQVLHLDSIEKQRLPLYGTDHYREGLYYSYAALAAQTPDIAEPLPQFSKKGSLKEVKIYMGEGQEVIPPQDFYALVHDGRIWVATEFGYSPLRKEGNDFFFNGRLRKTVPTGKAIAFGVAFGLVGALMVADGELQESLLRIDHINGGFLPVAAPAGR
ncbi:hypothetical protein [Flaviaesturariibacter aridisoli]|uniref:Uncharacterized protein n=1 Tax=Flaviaesturariibacter aridisoli TaxID=2545761 RepID=A0A4R4DZP7_9BACT|nr:hypothetical protein [Flaviaesturariibacter aridisoli]TCZ72161.1 hypothetical protein E0486_08700 [Flaviaesturariibacter aridisoli]